MMYGYKMLQAPPGVGCVLPPMLGGLPAAPKKPQKTFPEQWNSI